MRLKNPVWRRLLAIIGLIVVLVGLPAVPVAATELRSGDSIIIPANEVINDDLVVSGNTVTVEGTINGDLWIFASQAAVTGTVNGSCFLAGRTLALNGRVAGSFYAAGSSVNLGPEAVIGRNAYGAAYGFRAEPGSTVRLDLLATGYQVILDGLVQQDVQVASAAFVLNGRVGGDVTVDVDQPGSAPMFAYFIPGAPTAVAPGIRVGPQAAIGGTLTYRSPVEQSGAIQAAPAGGVIYQAQATPQPQPTQPAPTAAGTPAATPLPTPQPAPQRPTTGELIGRYLLGRVREFVTLAVLGALALWLLRRGSLAAVGKARARPLPSLGWGFVVLIVGYVAFIVALIVILIIAFILALLTLGSLATLWLSATLAGWGLAFTVFHALVAFGSILVVSYLVGRWVLNVLTRRRAERMWWSMLLGVALYVFLRTIPFIGWLITLAAVLIGLGAIFLVVRDRNRLTEAIACAPAPPEMPGGAR